MSKKDIKKQKIKSKPSDPNLSDDLDELEQDSSYEKTNEIFALKSEINLLKTENQKQSLDYDMKIKNLEAKYDKLVAQSNQRKIQNSNLVLGMGRLQRENQELKKVIESHRHQVQGNNRKTADFHRSIEDNKQNGLGDPTDLITQLLAKDKQIQTLKQKITSLQSNPAPVPIQSPPQSQSQLPSPELLSLRQTIDQLKKKQIAYKRQYEGMLQNKEDIIKKMVNQNQEFLRKVIQGKDKAIGELKREVEDGGRKREELAREAREAAEKVAGLEQALVKAKKQYLKKQEQLKSSFEAQKQSLTKTLQQKHKKSLLQKQQKQNLTESSLTTTQNQLQIHKQQLSKQKAQLTTLSQYSQYLQSTNRQLEQAKKKLQLELYAKEEEIIQVRDKFFMEAGEARRKMGEEKRELEGRLAKCEEELLAKRYMLERYEKMIKEQGQGEEKRNGREQGLLMELEGLRSANAELQMELLNQKQMYKQKVQAYMELEKSLRQDYEQRLKSIQASGPQAMPISSQPPSPSLPSPSPTLPTYQSQQQPLQQKLQKLQMINQLLQLQKQQKSLQQKSILSQKQKLQTTIKQLQSKLSKHQAKLKENQQDYRTLQIMYEELNEKYKSGVRDLEREITGMSEKIEEERRKVQRRRNQSSQVNANMKLELNEANARIKELEEEAGGLREEGGGMKEEIEVLKEEISTLNSRLQSQQLQIQQQKQKIGKLTHQLSSTTRQKQTLQKSHSRTLTQTLHTYQQQRASLLEYTQQLQQNIQILNTKLSQTHNKEQSLLLTIDRYQKQLKNCKIDYSGALGEIKQLMGKCRQLQEVSREAILHMEEMRGKWDGNWGAYGEVCKDRDKLREELEYAYDQVSKLNKLLMDKQQELSRSRIILAETQPQPIRLSTQTSPQQTPRTVQYQYIQEYPHIVSVPVARTYLTKSIIPTNESGGEEQGRYIRYDRIS